MREKAIPRYENDDFSPYAGSEYNVKENHGKSYVDEKINFTGKGPRGYQRTDDRIYEEVCLVLQKDRTIDASDIGVNVEDGIVTLEGRTKNRMQKRMAEMVTVEVPGVIDVRNEIVTLTGTGEDRSKKNFAVQSSGV